MLKKENKLNGKYGIGEVLKELRRSKKLTQVKLAEKLGVSINAVKQYEENKREPQYSYLIKICDFFNVSPDFLQSKNHYRIKDVPKYELAKVIPQQKSIIRAQNLSLCQYKVFLDDILKNNVNSTHVLFLINSLNRIIENMKNICINKKKNYIYYASDLQSAFQDEMYLEYNEKNNDTTLRSKPLSEMEAYLIVEEKFNKYMSELEKDLKKIFIANFKEDYPTYRKNFKRKLNYLQKELENSDK